MRISISILIATVGLWPFLVLAYECDTGELRRISHKEMTPLSSKKYFDEYKQVKEQQEKTIASLKNVISVGNDPKDFYLKTRMGQADLIAIQKLRAQYQYDAVSQYLVEDEVLNTQRDHYTTIYKQQFKTFYLNRGRLVAIAEQKRENEILLTRLNRSCQPFEVVSFSTLDPEARDKVRYKITPKLCRSYITHKRVPAHQEMPELLSYVSHPENRATLGGIERDCKLLKRSSAMPPAPKQNKSVQN